MQLSQIAAEFKAHFEAVETEAQRYLAEHIPGVLQVADKLDNDPLVQAAVETILPDDVKTMVTNLIKSLESKFPPPAPAPEPEPEPAEPQPEPADPA